MRISKMEGKMLLSILPIVIVAMTVLTLLIGNTSEQIIGSIMTASMDTLLEENKKIVDDHLDDISLLTDAIRSTVVGSEGKLPTEAYEEIIKQLLADNPLAIGGGIFFEPYAYNAEKYVAPYAYKQGSELVATDAYTDPAYDYLSQSFYTLAKEKGQLIFTDAIYDAALGQNILTCAIPIEVNGTFMGCAAIDFSLQSIQELVLGIPVGISGHAILLNEDGMYLGGVEAQTIQQQKTILQEEEVELKELGKELLQQESGAKAIDVSGEKWETYYSTLDTLPWRIVLFMPRAELDLATKPVMRQMLIVGIAAIILTALGVSFSIKAFVKRIKTVKAFTDHLGDGNFTIDPLRIVSKDEIGEMGEVLNHMYERNKNIIMKIADDAQNIQGANKALDVSANGLNSNFARVKESIGGVNEEIVNISAATEEVNASTEEVEGAIVVLEEELGKTLTIVQNTKIRALEMEATIEKSGKQTATLATQYDLKLHTSIENVKVVEEIGEMAKLISSIASQINLLSLNASIEAARAGEYGRGFAVVAEEIGKLATETGDAVKHIQKVIASVLGAVNSLSQDSRDLLGFLQDHVVPDYTHFNTIAGTYVKDTDAIVAVAADIKEKSTQIRMITQEVVKAISGIAQSTEGTANASADMTETVEQVATLIDGVKEMAHSQLEIAMNLQQLVSFFKL